MEQLDARFTDKMRLPGQVLAQLSGGQSSRTKQMAEAVHSALLQLRNPVLYVHVRANVTMDLACK